MENYKFSSMDMINITLKNNYELFNSKLSVAKQFEKVDFFINQEVDGETLLWIFITEREIQLANLLFDLGTPKLVTKDIGNELHILVDRITLDNIEECLYLVENLVRSGLDINFKDNYNNTAFTAVCSWAVRGKWYPEKKKIINICLECKPEIISETWGGQNLKEILIQLVGYTEEEIDEYYK